MAKTKPPEISPYVVSALLAGFGLWCAYDGWVSSDPRMAEHQVFNRVASVILLPWAAIDFLRVRRREQVDKGPPPASDATPRP